MKTVFAFLMMLVIVAGCATTGETDRSDSSVKYGGSARIRGQISHGN